MHQVTSNCQAVVKSTRRCQRHRQHFKQASSHERCRWQVVRRETAAYTLKGKTTSVSLRGRGKPRRQTLLNSYSNRKNCHRSFCSKERSQRCKVQEQEICSWATPNHQMCLGRHNKLFSWGHLKTWTNFIERADQAKTIRKLLKSRIEVSKYTQCHLARYFHG